MLTMNDIKAGTVLLFDGAPNVVLSAQHVQMGRGSAILRVKIRNLVNGSVLEQTLKHGDKFDEAALAHGKATFLYGDERDAYFMDGETFDQFPIAQDVIGGQSTFLKEGQEVDVLKFNDKAVNIQLPVKVELTVTEAAEGVRGDTAQGSVTKEVKLENGLSLRVPLFIKQGDVIRVNTDTGAYVERA
jgi:elongation factor P